MATKHRIKDLNRLVKLGAMTEEYIQMLRDWGLVLEKRTNEIRYVPGTTLIPHFYFKNVKANELNDEARKMKSAIYLLIKEFTISKEEHEKNEKVLAKKTRVKKKDTSKPDDPIIVDDKENEDSPKRATVKTSELQIDNIKDSVENEALLTEIEALAGKPVFTDKGKSLELALKEEKN